MESSAGRRFGVEAEVTGVVTPVLLQPNVIKVCEASGSLHVAVGGDGVNNGIRACSDDD